MNTKSLKFLVIVVASLGLGACDSGSSSIAPPVVSDPPTPPDPVVPPETGAPPAVVVTGSVVNEDDLLVSDVTLTFREDGVLATSLLDLEGNTFSSLTSADGTFAFTLAEDASFETLRIRAEAADFLRKIELFDFTGAPEDRALVLEMRASNADGVASQSTSAAVSSGTVAEEVQATAATPQTTATVTVPGATELRDASGNPVSGSSVSVDVSVVNTESSGEGAVSIGDVIPPGLAEAVAAATGDTGSIQDVQAASDITMVDDQGVAITQFSQPISVTIDAPDNGTLAEGQTLELSSYDDTTEEWTVEPFDATVGARNDATGTFPVTFQTDHLTFFSASRSIPVCSQDMALSVSGAAVPSSGLYVSVTSVDASVSSYIRAGATSKVLVSASTSRRYGISSDATANVRIYDASGNDWFNSAGEVAVCGNIPVTLADPVARVSESFSVTATCTNDTSVSSAVTSAVVRYGRANRTKIKAQTNGDGTYSLADMVQGETYEIAIAPGFSDQNGAVPAQSDSVVADGTDESFDISVACAGGTGGGS